MPAQDTPDKVQETQRVTFALPNNHVNKDSSQWRTVATKKGNLGAVLPDPEDTQEDSPELHTPIPPTTTTPSGDTTRMKAKRTRKRNPMH